MTAVAASTSVGAEAQAGVRTEKPNIIFIVSDQHRVGLTKRSGYPLDTSPAQDALAASGIAFDRAYCSTPLCMPSRVTMLTGRWPEAHRVRTNHMPEAAFFEKDLYQVAKDQGYKTALIGKNHTYLDPKTLDHWRNYNHGGGPHGPNEPQMHRDYDEWLRKLDYNLSLEPTPFPVEAQLPYRIVNDSIEFMKKMGDQPFILQVGIPEPHDPEQVPKPYWDMFPPEQVPARCAGPEALDKLGYRAQWLYGLEQDVSPLEANWRRYKSNYLGSLRMIDDQLARLMDYLRQSDLVKNTIVIFTADHGEFLMDYGLARKGIGLPECLTRIPMVWAGWHVKPSPAAAKAHVSLADMMPTLCEVMGAEIPRGVQGRSLWPLLEGREFSEDEFRSMYVDVGVGGLYYTEADKVPYSVSEKRPQGIEPFFDELNKVTQSGLQKMVRMGDWKLIFDMMGYGQLYHLPSDPCELKNLYGEPSVAKEQARLMEELMMWTIRNQDSLPTGVQGNPMQTKWPAKHNWYAPYRRGTAPQPFIP